ncbi:MAG TPA: chemotaxis protein CheX [Gammaproteobacteria bacterium]|nr:chemotaxis protein CheX [Gammaproteobacteria bacterium]
MKAEFINPVLESTLDVLTTMAHLEATPGEPKLKESDRAHGDVTGIIGMTGTQARGSLAVTFPAPVILEITKRMMHMEVNEVSDLVTDLVGEIANMVLGGAKRRLEDQGYDFDLALPAVVSGTNHTISHKTDGPKILLPFASEPGEFFVEICFEE